MEGGCCELYTAAGNVGKEESRQRKRDMVVDLKILEARNIVVKPACSKRTHMFVRYYLHSGGDGEGNNVAVNTREVLVMPDPHWKQSFRLECRGSLFELQKQFVMLELRQRRRVKILGISMFRTSKVVASVQVPWKDLLASPTLSISSWFPLVCSDTSAIIEGSQLPPSLHLSISLNFPNNAVDSDSWPPYQHRMAIHKTKRVPRISKTKVANESSWGVGLDQEVMIWKTESKRNGNMSRNVDKRMRRLERG